MGAAFRKMRGLALPQEKEAKAKQATAQAQAQAEAQAQERARDVRQSVFEPEYTGSEEDRMMRRKGIFSNMGTLFGN